MKLCGQMSCNALWNRSLTGLSLYLGDQQPIVRKERNGFDWQNPQPGSQPILAMISHNIMSTCLILCWSVFAAKTALIRQGIDCTRQMKVSCGTNSFSPVSCNMRRPWILVVCPAHPSNARLDWDLWNLEDKSTPQLIVLLKPYQNKFCFVAGSVILL